MVLVGGMTIRHSSAMSHNSITALERNDLEDFLDAKKRSEDVSLVTAQWINEMTWHSMITLTVDDKHPCYRKESFFSRIKFLFRCLNSDLYGSNYHRVVGHSYFSYVIGFEFHVSQILHAHVLVSKPIDYKMVHAIWNKMSGFAYIKPVENNQGACLYVSKYVTKDGDLIIFKNQIFKPPLVFPTWWFDLDKP